MTTKQQSILPFQMEAMPSSDALTSHAGLPLVAETMRALGLEQAARDHLHLQQRNAGLSDYQKIESVVLLMAAGGDGYDDMALLRADAGLQRLLGYRLPSPDSLRCFANAFHDEQLIVQAKAHLRPPAVACNARGRTSARPCSWSFVDSGQQS